MQFARPTLNLTLEQILLGAMDFATYGTRRERMEKQAALAVLLAVFTGASMAARPTFDEVDVNGDGTITMQEAANYEGLMTSFDNADEDRDGRLSKAEYQKLTTAS